jgi:hypothetical protein
MKISKEYCSIVLGISVGAAINGIFQGVTHYKKIIANEKAKNIWVSKEAEHIDVELQSLKGRFSS